MKLNPAMTARLKIFFLVGVIIFFTLLLYGQTISFEYVWDDLLVVDLHVGALLENGITVRGLGHPFLVDRPFFRPLVILSFYLDGYVSGKNPGFFHGMNLLFFVVNLLLVFWLALRMARVLQHRNPVGIAFFSALVYAVHPALTEPVVWVSGRFDLLATTFILCATHVFLGEDRGIRSTLAFAFFSLCALLSKEIGILIPFSLFFLYVAARDQRAPLVAEMTSRRILGNFLRENINFWIAFVVVLFIYFSYRFQYPENYIWNSGSGSGIFDHFRDGGVFIALKLYFQDAFVPFYGISPRHPVLGKNLAPIDLLMCRVAVVLLLWILFQSLRKRSIAASIFMAGFLYLVPVLLLAPGNTSGGDVISDRYLAAPLAFWVIAVSMARYDLLFVHSLREKFRLNRRIFWALPAGWLIMALVFTATIIPFWKNEVSLWNWTYRLHPNDEFTRSNYFTALFWDKQIDRLEKEILRLLETAGADKIDMHVWVTYGNVLIEKKDPESLAYLEALANSVPIFKIHLLGDGATQARSQMGATNALYATNVFLNYSLATFAFGKDIPKAMALNEIARWYSIQTEFTQSMIRSGQEKSAQLDFEYNEILHLYADGKFDAAEAKLDLMASQDRVVAESYVRRHLKDFCQEKLPEYAATCDALQASGLI